MPVMGLCAARTVNIDSVENAYPAEDIVLDSGSRVVVTYSYRGGAKTMKEALIDKIKVNSTGDAAEPYVAFVVDGDGLNNDVDFSEQPHLWLSSPPKGQAWENNNYKILVGLYEPYGDTYKFGYGGTAFAGESGILVTNLVDNPVTGAPRNIVLQGKGVTCIRSLNGGKCTLSGTLTVGENADLGTGTTAGYANLSKITFKNGSRFVLKATSGSLAAKTDVVFEGSVGISVNGGDSIGNPPLLSIGGSVSGSGTISLIDQGGIAFLGTNNTYSGTVKSTNNSAGDVPQCLQVGNGGKFSWGTGTLETKRGRECVVFNADSNLTFAASVVGPGRFVKRGKGVLTLASPPDRTGAVAAGLYAFEIENGGFALGGAVPAKMEGLMRLSSASSSFDVCGRADTTYLPEGSGKVLSTGGSALVLRGGWTNDVVFSGSLACPAAVELLGDTVWRMTERTSLAGDLEILSGTAVAEAFFVTTNAVTVDETAVLKFNSDEFWRRRDLTGLLVDFWDIESRCYEVGSSHADRLDAALEKAESEPPMYTADMTEFARLQNGDNVNGSNKDCPFAKVLGAYKTKYATDPNYFAAVFSGFLHVEQGGTYQFRMRADDSGIIWLDGQQILRFAYGNSSSASGVVERNLTAGDHPFKVLFGEESGWDVLMVEIKGPDVPEWQCVPVEMLKPCVGAGTCIGALRGAGAIGLEPNGIWPEAMPTEDFTGKVIVDGNTKPATSGMLALSSATLRFDDGWSVDGTNWTLCGAAAFDPTLGGPGTIRATPGAAKQNGGVNTSNPIPVTGPWSVEFDFSAVEPFSGNNIGDGFVIVLHNGGAKQTTGGTFQYTEASKRIGCTSAYGIQCFINRDWNYSVWMKDGNAYAAAGGFETNTTRFTMTKIKNHPMHMKMEYDGSEKMIVSYAVDGIYLVRTNVCAGADLAELFPNGAYLGIWAANGEAYASACIDNVKLTLPGVTDANSPEFGGTLALTGGAISDIGPAAGVLSGNLAVKGSATLSANAPLDVTSPTWTFDVAAGTLSFSGDCRFADNVTVELVGVPPKGQTLLADFTATTGGLPTVALGAGYPKKLSLVWRGRQLYLERATGLLIFIK